MKLGITQNEYPRRLKVTLLDLSIYHTIEDGNFLDGLTTHWLKHNYLD